MKIVRTILRLLLHDWVVATRTLLRLLWALLHRRRSAIHRPSIDSDCVPISHPAMVRPDPLLYAQQPLLAQGLAVTWDNPDITLSRSGVPVSSSELEPNTTYDVTARIWNAATDAPVVNMPVRLSFLDFGIGTTAIPVGTATVDVGVKGSPTQPGFATIPWTTPPTPGHFCLQVQLDPADDRDRTNNLGQENTDVREAHSPATFTFALRNDTHLARTYRLQPDGYQLPDQPVCADLAEVPAGSVRGLDRHRRDQHPVPDGWTVAFIPAEPTLLPGEQVHITATVEPAPGFVGRRDINVNALHDAGFAGGVTLTVVKEI